MTDPQGYNRFANQSQVAVNSTDRAESLPRTVDPRSPQLDVGYPRATLTLAVGWPEKEPPPLPQNYETGPTGNEGDL